MRFQLSYLMLFTLTFMLFSELVSHDKKGFSIKKQMEKYSCQSITLEEANSRNVDIVIIDDFKMKKCGTGRIFRYTSFMPESHGKNVYNIINDEAPYKSKILVNVVAHDYKDYMAGLKTAAKIKTKYINISMEGRYSKEEHIILEQVRKKGTIVVAAGGNVIEPYKRVNIEKLKGKARLEAIRKGLSKTTSGVSLQLVANNPVFTEKEYKLIDKAVRAGTYIELIKPESLGQEKCKYPACLKEVISVAHIAPDGSYESITSDKYIDFAVVKKFMKDGREISGSSYTSAYMTGHIAQEYYGKNKEEVMEALANKAMDSKKSIYGVIYAK